ncbi:MAG TPA: HEAT repeat domain-containing protein [Anaerolineales bacterium]|nr:HEAT repeat domain-containing protein [Anaerolineales bacterium]
MSSSFDSLLAAMAAPGTSVPPADLAFLSDLDATQLERLQKLWTSLTPERRREILREIGILARDHIELNFDRVDRMALEDSDSEVRRLAIDNLWECEDPRLVPQLLHILRSDEDAAARAAAASALGAFVYLGEVERLPAGLLQDIESELLNAARHAAQTIRLRSIESLGFSSRPEVPLLISQAYRSGDEDSRRSALLAMSRSADEAWATEVQAELRSPSPVLRLEAVRAAGELELSSSVGDVVDLLEDADLEVRRAAIWSLGQIGGKRSAEVLGRLLDEAEGEEALLVEDALDQLAFVDGVRDFTLLDLDGEAEDEEDEEETEEGEEEESP